MYAWKPDHLHKFLNNWDVPCVIDLGSLKFGRLQYYSLLEFMTGDDWIGDKKEGRVSGIIDGVANSPAQRQVLAEASIMSITGNGSAIFQNCKYHTLHEGFALCFSHGDLKKVMPQMTADRNNLKGYDRCLRINDLDTLLNKIRNGQLSKPFEGKKCADVFEIKHGKVEYEAHYESNILSDLKKPKMNFFLKDKKYAIQSEYRIVLLPKTGMQHSCDNVFVVIEGAEKEFIEISTGKENGIKPNISEINREEYEGAMQFLHRCLNYLTTMKGCLGGLFEQYAQKDPSLARLVQTQEADVELSRMSDTELFKAISIAYWKIRKSSHNSTRMDRAIMIQNRTTFKIALEEFLA